MKVAIGSDHGGFELKEYLKKYMDKKGVDYKDFGTFSDESCDYPDFGQKVGAAVRFYGFERGVLICTTGIGMSITVNKYKKIRAALCHNLDSVKYSRLHNDSNVLVLGSKYVKKKLAGKMLNVFLETEFEAGRHEKRINKIGFLETLLL
ncbi:MAG: ribose 5-phosphate isomerase B [Nanoarchaeota archaeon]|nr:ribose 5-phosphate isomerase B [Nanoarchaeota archaeon]